MMRNGRCVPITGDKKVPAPATAIVPSKTAIVPTSRKKQNGASMRKRAVPVFRLTTESAVSTLLDSSSYLPKIWPMAVSQGIH